MRARHIRDTVINTFVTTYKLKTLAQGALVREWPRGYSLWNEDASNEGGYRLLQTYVSDPPIEEIFNVFDAANPDATDEKKGEPSVASSVIGGVVSFFQGLTKL